jgi:hypothetical protein
MIMSNDATPGSHNQFLKQGIEFYLDVIKPLHLFQTQIADMLKQTVEASSDKIAVLMKLSEKPGEVSRSVYPEFPTDTWDYEGCDIYAKLLLGTPQHLSLYLGMGFKTLLEGGRDCTLYCAVEVSQRYRRNHWLSVFQGNPDLLNEEWGGYAVGLRRPLKDPDHLKEESVLLLDDFLKCL